MYAFNDDKSKANISFGQTVLWLTHEGSSAYGIPAKGSADFSLQIQLDTIIGVTGIEFAGESGSAIVVKGYKVSTTSSGKEFILTLANTSDSVVYVNTVKASVAYMSLT